ncbi:ankyrin repeat-containing domain protein [Neocallimastix lanati (nom. inval.)]|nr:ankyrin repeat-containing domain protein [Neocallimastix sp. JGI-2020a]
MNKVYANKNNIILEINEKDNDGLCPIVEASTMINIEIIKLLIDYSNGMPSMDEYANKNNITLKINEKNENGDYPLLFAIYNNNIEIVKLLINYAHKNKYQIRLPWAIRNNKIKIVKLLIKYVFKNNIKLKINQTYKDGNYLFMNAVS